MRTLLLSLFAVIITALSANAQSLDDLFDRYKAKENVTSMQINKEAFGFYMAMIPDSIVTEQDDLNELIAQINMVKILTTSNRALTGDLNAEIDKLISAGDFTPMMLVEEASNEVQVLFKGERDKMSDIFVVVKSPGETVLVAVEGLVSQKTVQKVLKKQKMNIHFN